MHIDQIKTFLAVYRAGSFIDVANEKNIAPSSVSRAVASLEEALKTRLFQRTTRKLVPTQAGAIYFEKMVPLIEEMDLVNQSLTDVSTTPSGRLRVTASVSYGQIMLAPKLSAFRTLYPKIELELILSDTRIDLVENQIDVSIRHGALPDSSLVARKLTGVSYRLVASHSYLDRFGIPDTPDELGQHELVTFTYQDYRSTWMFQQGDALKSVVIKPGTRITNAAAIRECVLNGQGIALLANWTIRDDIALDTLSTVLPDWQVRGTSDDSAIWIVYPSNRFIPAKTRVFVDYILSVIDKE